MRIAIVNCWSDDNKGDSAIVQGLICSLTGVSNRRMSFDLMSMFQGPADAIREHYRHTTRVRPRIRVWPSLFPFDARETGIRRLRLRLLQLGRALILLLRPLAANRLLRGEERETFEMLRKADVVISRGGHIYSSAGSLKSLYGLFRNGFPILLAHRLGRPTVIYGHSIGPLKGTLARCLVRRVFAEVNGLYLRESLSLKLVGRLMVRHDRPLPKLCWDTAFVVEEEDLDPHLELELPDQFVAVTVRQWAFQYHDGDRAQLYANYLESIRSCIQRLWCECGVPSVVVPQALGPTTMEDDLRAAADLRSMDEVGDRTMFLYSDFTPGQLKGIYRRADLVLATRFHSAILAVSAGTPAMAVSYHGPKTMGIMRLLDLEEYVIDIGEVTGAELFKRCTKLLARREQISERLRRRVRDIRRSVMETSMHILEEAGTASD